MHSITEKLFLLQDESYRILQAKIIPNINSNEIIGVRTPVLKKIAKEMVKDDYLSFLNDLPHQYFDENQLHAFILSELKDYNECITFVNQFLPYINNWATCDQLSPKVFKKHTDELLKEISHWIHSQEPYTIRFGIGMLMHYFLDDLFQEQYLEWVCSISSSEYYVNMMIAWFFATALAKQYDKTISFFVENKLDIWTHNKTIQKAIESYRVSQEHKDYLKTLRRKSSVC